MKNWHLQDEGFDSSSHQGTPWELREPYGYLQVPHKCPHTTIYISLHSKVGHQEELGVDG